MVTKILKMHENNQYGNVMAQPLPTGIIKKIKKIPSMRKFDLIIQGILDKDKIGHLFVVDIEFDHENAEGKELFFNGTYTPNF